MKTLLSIILSLLITSAQAGFTEGIDALGKGDHKTAIFNFKEALKDEEEESFKDRIYGLLGISYYAEEEGIDDDYKLTFESFKKASNTHNEMIHNMLGKLYLFGRGTEQDYRKAKEQFELAIKYKDHKESIWRLGKIYLHGLGRTPPPAYVR